MHYTKKWILTERRILSSNIKKHKTNNVQYFTLPLIKMDIKGNA